MKKIIPFIKKFISKHYEWLVIAIISLIIAFLGGAIYCTFKNSDKSEYQKTVSSLIENESYSNGHYFIANPKEHTVDEIIIFKEEY